MVMSSLGFNPWASIPEFVVAGDYLWDDKMMHIRFLTHIPLTSSYPRFDLINVDFQDLMRAGPEITNVVEACNLEGRQERLENQLSQLELCEKALQASHPSYPSGGLSHSAWSCTPLFHASWFACCLAI